MSKEGDKTTTIPSPAGGRNTAEKTELPRATKAQQSETLTKLREARRKLDEQLAEHEAEERRESDRPTDPAQTGEGPERGAKREPLSGQRVERTEGAQSPQLEAWLAAPGKDAGKGTVPQYQMSSGRDKPSGWGESTGWGKTSGWEDQAKDASSKDDPEFGSFAHDTDAEREQHEKWENSNWEKMRRDERRDEVVHQLLEEVGSLQKELRGGRPQGSGGKDSSFRIGNIVAKIPTLAEPARNTEDRLVQLADYTRDLNKYVEATLYENPAGCLEELKQRSIGAHRVLIETKPRERNGVQESRVTIPYEISREQDRYFRSIAPLIEDRVDSQVRRELEDFDDLGLFGFHRILAILMCVRRVYDVRSLEDLDRIEKVARNPHATEYEELRVWWTVARSAQKTGHVSWSQVARGLTKLVEDLEEKKRFLPRIMRDVTHELTTLGLTEFGAKEGDITSFTRFLLGVLRDHKAPKARSPWKAHVATDDWEDEPGDGNEEDDNPGGEVTAEGEPTDEELWDDFNAFRAAKGKGKGAWKGKGRGKGKEKGRFQRPIAKTAAAVKPTYDKPAAQERPTQTKAQVKCYKCGGAHYLWDCPVDRERTAKGLCWICGGQHLKRDCPEASNVKAYLADLYADDEGEEHGDDIPPAPNEA